MRRSTRSTLVMVIATAATACGYGYEMRSTEIAGTTTVTSGPPAGERELSRSVGDVSDRIANEVCLHEVNCGRPQSRACLEAMSSQAARELMSWECDPASIRARAEQCLAGIDELTCERNLTSAERLCPAVDTCARYEAELIPPGPALASVWTR